MQIQLVKEALLCVRFQISLEEEQLCHIIKKWHRVELEHESILHMTPECVFSEWWQRPPVPCHGRAENGVQHVA